MPADLQDVHVDLIALGQHRKALVVWRTNDGFHGRMIEMPDTGAADFTGKTLQEVTIKARGTVEPGPW